MIDRKTLNEIYELIYVQKFFKKFGKEEDDFYNELFREFGSEVLTLFEETNIFGEREHMGSRRYGYYWELTNLNDERMSIFNPFKQFYNGISSVGVSYGNYFEDRRGYVKVEFKLKKSKYFSSIFSGFDFYVFTMTDKFFNDWEGEEYPNDFKYLIDNNLLIISEKEIKVFNKFLEMSLIFLLKVKEKIKIRI